MNFAMKPRASIILSFVLAALTFGAEPARSAVTERVSVDNAGNEGNAESADAAMTPDGRFVAFASLASNLVPGDTNNASDVFVHDRLTGTTERVSVSSNEREGNADSGFIGPVLSRPALTDDGRFVLFHSDASNLVGGDRNGATDIFLRDRLNGTTERVSVSSGGAESNGFSYDPSVSPDGRFVAFTSNAFNLVPNDTNFTDDIFVRDRQTGTTERVSVDSAGNEANGTSFRPSISADGRFVAFQSSADNLVPGGSTFFQVYVKDRQAGAVERLSQAADGTPGNFNSGVPSISNDGRFVAFESSASNLVPGDTNNQQDIFIADRQTHTLELASVDSAEVQGNDFSGVPSISSDGQFVAFFSLASNLVAGDTNNEEDIFVRDRQAGTTARVSVNGAGGEANGESVTPAIGDGGLVVAFQSIATNLVIPTTNLDRDIYVHDRRSADLSVDKTDSADPVAVRTNLTYTATVANQGPTSTTNVILTDTLPEEATFVSATPSQGSCNRTGMGPRGGTLTCDLGTLANGGSATVTIVIQPARTGIITNTATVTSVAPDPNPANNSDTETTTVF